MAPGSRATSTRAPRQTVALRPPAATDLQAFLDLNRQSIRFYRGLAYPMLDPKRFTAYVEPCRQPNFEGLLVCRRADGAIVGCVNLSEIVRGPFQSAYMGYQVFAPFARQGYMTAAMPLVLRHAFGHLKLHRVEANIQPTNVASINLVTRAGFEQEGYSPRYLKIGGRWRDHERWAMTRERYNAVRARTR